MFKIQRPAGDHTVNDHARIKWWKSFSRRFLNSPVFCRSLNRTAAVLFVTIVLLSSTYVTNDEMSANDVHCTSGLGLGTNKDTTLDFRPKKKRVRTLAHPTQITKSMEILTGFFQKNLFSVCCYRVFLFTDLYFVAEALGRIVDFGPRLGLALMIFHP